MARNPKDKTFNRQSESLVNKLKECADAAREIGKYLDPADHTPWEEFEELLEKARGQLDKAYGQILNESARRYASASDVSGDEE